jgi:Arc/MetJ-type ribon-helix-helix transcriptional regulator
MNFNYNLDNFKNKKDLIAELNYYKSIILKKVKSGDYNSALEKVRSAIVLIQEHQEYFNIEKELIDFYELNKEVQSELKNHRMIYERRFNNLLREKLNESNLENFSKLLAMLKSDVDQNLEKYNLEDICLNITKYFKFIKKVYEILSCYKVLNYHDASGKIFDFVKDVKCENFPNLKFLISSVYQNLLNYRLYEYSKEFEKVSISTLSKKMAINQESLVDFINLIMKQPKSPIKGYISETQEIYFKKPRI